VNTKADVHIGKIEVENWHGSGLAWKGWVQIGLNLAVKRISHLGIWRLKSSFPKSPCDTVTIKPKHVHGSINHTFYLIM